ncbi:MFS transporter [Streptomyces sp. SAS_269]|uniref:MFS transporter n=1 Tax=Streptomyces sp. SAS_269 TaxID=3412749 RepID=UPI00403D50E0
MSTVGARTNATTLPIVLGLSLAFAVTAIDPLVLSLNLPQLSRSLHVPPQLLGLLTGAATLCMTAGIGAAAGPMLGGLITNYLGWRVSLLMEALINLAVVLFMRRTVAPGRTRAHPGQRFDVLGALLSATGFGLLVVATLLAGRYGLLQNRQDFEVFGVTLLHRGGVSPVPLLAGIGLVILVVFAAWERHLIRRGGDPLVRLSVLRDRTVRVGTLTLVTQILVPTGVLLLVPVFLQTTVGFDAPRSGVTLIAVPVGLMVAAPAAAGLVANGRMTHRTAQMGAFLCMASGCALIAVMFDPHQREVTAMGLALAPGLLLVGVGRGLATTVTDLIQSAPPPEEVSDVTGLSRTAGYLGSSFQVALAGAFMATALLWPSRPGRTPAGSCRPARSLVKRTLDHQVQITAATDDAVRAKLASRDVTGTAADELVRVNARARGQALTVAALGMGAPALMGFALALRIPRAGGPGR